ncbi:MAG: Mfa1 family fimbria major subunit [Bacteroidales bacterium]|nr:Mfa1 family fimbria major subunit [Porphyromonas sp.]MDD6934281.1 Mfa1 family fimbria major subunit [Bacteroidales bacterium]MDY3101561.1 Mfa1 family fimbria major subunit [Porphyromonas sp.]
MMKIKTMAGLLLATLSLFASCAKSTKEVKDPALREGNTFVGITLNMGGSLRAGGEDENFNHKGKWNGKDLIETIDVYIVDGATVSTGQFNKNNFTIKQEVGGDGINIVPNTAIRTTPGVKKVYALINAPASITQDLATASAAEFERVFNDTKKKIAISEVASNNGTADKIMAANYKECSVNVQPGVTEEEAKNPMNPKNRAKVEMKRVVARVLVTSTQATYDVFYNDKTTKMGVVSDITYAGAQGEHSFYIRQKFNGMSLVVSPGYDWVATNDNFIAEANNYYDYSDLKTMNRKATVAADGLPDVAKIGEASLKSSLFMFEATHAYQQDASNRDVASYDGNFRRGNTAYVLVRAIFTPDKNAFADGGGASYTKGTDFYLGANNRFYISKENTQDPAKGGVKGQQYRHYVKGKVLYYAFVNPDNVEKTLDAPVLRNNIYHISVNGFSTIGTNWNPIYPEDPDTTDPKNPDPKPSDDPKKDDDPDTPDPNPNPIDPGDPDSPANTWMSVEMTVVPWAVHSYSITLGL